MPSNLIFDRFEKLVRPFSVQGPPVASAKAELESLASAARMSVLDKVRLADTGEVLRFRLANDLIEQLGQIARLALRVNERAQLADSGS